MEKILDVREMAPKDRHSTIFETFRNLKPGEAFILVNDHEPKPLLYQFQNEHDGEFDWWTLESGPQVWRVEIVKRKESDASRTVTEFLQTDHRRLDGIFNRFEDELGAGRFEEAAKDFREFAFGLKKHIGVEENILFPLFEQKTGMVDSGPTFVMKMEHKEIKDLMDSILSATEAHDASKARHSAQSLMDILADHNMKEEHILYPESDSFLSDAERVQVVKKGQAA